MFLFLKTKRGLREDDTHLENVRSGEVVPRRKSGGVVCWNSLFTARTAALGPRLRSRCGHCAHGTGCLLWPSGLHRFALAVRTGGCRLAEVTKSPASPARATAMLLQKRSALVSRETLPVMSALLKASSRRGFVLTKKIVDR